MLRTSLTIAVLIALCSGASAQDQIPVPASQGWHGTGVQVGVGQRLIIEASGLVCTRVNCDTPDDWVDPDGNCPGLPEPGDCYTESCSDCFVPGMPNGLIGRVGSGDPFVVGSQLRMVSDFEGELQLTYNDGYYPDNSGQYDVYVVVVNALPSIGTFGIIALVLILIGTAGYLIRRRRIVA